LDRFLLHMLKFFSIFGFGFSQIIHLKKIADTEVTGARNNSFPFYISVHTYKQGRSKAPTHHVAEIIDP
jgi:hypothetical protein